MAITFHPDGRIIDSSGNDLAYKPIYDVWQITGNLTGNQNIIAGSEWTRSSTTNTNKSGAHTNVGTAMSVDSTGYWTFPSSGKWEVTLSCNWQSISGTACRWCEPHLYFTQNNSDYNYIARPQGSVNSSGSGVYDTFEMTALLDIVDTSTHKIYFKIAYETGNSNYLKGYSTFMATYASFIRIAGT
tara:strand:+ start:1437 stop:1994 length:558 start_codon:yes stop_codon:yes gene_type:complete